LVAEHHRRNEIAMGAHQGTILSKTGRFGGDAGNPHESARYLAFSGF
jgi:hypothetical protein